MAKLDDELKAIIKHYGAKHQIAKSIEELSELTAELSRFLNGANNKKAISEEMADCLIMLRQLEIIFNNGNEVKKQGGYKIHRTRKKINAEMPHM